MNRDCFVLKRRNSVLDGMRSSLFEFIQENMPENVWESISSK